MNGFVPPAPIDPRTGAAVAVEPVEAPVNPAVPAPPVAGSTSAQPDPEGDPARGLLDALRADEKAKGDAAAAERQAAFDALTIRMPDVSWGTMIGTDEFAPKVVTDADLADAMLIRVSPAVRRVLGKGDRWLLRSVERWAMVDEVSGRIVRECVKRMPTGDPKPVAKDAEPTEAQRIAKRRKRLEMSSGASPVATAIRAATAGGRHPLVVDLAELDQDPEILWAGGWPFDLRASREVPTRAARVDLAEPHLKAAAFKPDPRIATPAWTTYVETVWPDQEIREWALDVLATGLTGYGNGIVPLLFGPGGSGKSSMNGFILRLLGNYAKPLKHEILTPQCPPNMIADLLGVRYAVLDEAPPTSKSGAEQFKSLTGGIPLSGRPLYGNTIDVVSTWTLAMTSNASPVLDDPAVVRRLRLIPCDAPQEKIREAVRALLAEFSTEAPGILAGFMRRAAQWLAEPATVDPDRAPAAVVDVMAALAAEHDHVTRWLTGSGEVAPDPAGDGLTVTDLHRPFVAWWAAQGLDDRDRPGTKGLAQKLDASGFPSRKDGTGRRSRALRLTRHLDRPGAAWNPGGLAAWSRPPP